MDDKYVEALLQGQADIMNYIGDIKREIATFKEDVATLKEQSATREKDVAHIMEDVATLKKQSVTREDVAHIMNVIVENSVTPKFNLLADGQQNIIDTLTPKSEVEALKDEIDLLKMVIRTLSADVAELKKAQ